MLQASLSKTGKLLHITFMLCILLSWKLVRQM